MDPISLAIGAVGLGMSIFGGMGQASKSAEAAQISKDEAQQEQGINAAKQQQMEIEARRTQLENVRNSQRARAMATNAAVSQGAAQGSGLQGGLGQIQDQNMFNQQGVNQALGIGRQIGTFNSLISNDKMKMADVQSQSASDAGMASLGGALIKAGPIIGQIGAGATSGFGNAMSLFSPGSLSGGLGRA